MIRLPGLSAVAKGRPRLSRVFSGILLALIAFLAVSVRLGGIGDRRAWNPDEALISHWMKRHQAGAGFDAFYPGGFFVMSRPAKIVFENLINRPLWKIALKSGLTDVAYSPRGMAHRQWGLLFNLFLTVLSIGLVYHLGSMIVGSRTGALAGAFAFAFHPVFVEHSHYLETDIAMLFCAVLALWAMTRYRRAPRACTLAFCAFICGFGFGVKYTNAVLLPVLLLLIVAMRFKRNRDMPNLEARAGVLTASDSFLSKGVRWARRSCVPLIVIAIAFFVLGNEVATPRSAPKPERRPAPAVEASDVPPPAAQASDAVSASATRFIKAAKHLRTESQDLIAGEGQRERLVFLARSFAMALAAPGVPWLLFVAAGMVVLVASPTFRLHLPLTLGYPVAYVGMIAVAAPWFRNQEILPLLPSFSLAIAALVSVSAGCLRNGRADASRPLSLFLVQRIGAGFVLLSVCAVFTFAWMRAADLDDIFAKPDTRESAADFLTQAFPVEESIFLDRQMIVNVPGMTNVVKGGAWLGESIESYRAANPGLRWFLVNGSLAGRGMLDPITGRLRPAFREREHAFRRRARLAQS
jgi:predicted membrane-bound mannosyltransferase